MPLPIAAPFIAGGLNALGWGGAALGATALGAAANSLQGRPRGEVDRRGRPIAQPARRVPTGNHQSPFAGYRDAAFTRARSGSQQGEPPSARIQPGAVAAPAPGGGGDPNGAPVPRVTPRAEVQSQALGTAIQQAQGPSFWQSNTALKEAAESGPRAGTAGYSNRADIQAWIEAMNKTPAGQAMVQQFLDKERKAGRISDGTAAAGPLTSNDAILKAQAAGALDDFQGGSTDDAILWAQGKGALGETTTDTVFSPAGDSPAPMNPEFWKQGFEPGQRLVTPELARAVAAQPAFEAQDQTSEPLNYADAFGTPNPLLAEHLRRAGLNF